MRHLSSGTINERLKSAPGGTTINISSNKLGMGRLLKGYGDSPPAGSKGRMKIRVTRKPSPYKQLTIKGVSWGG